MSSISLSSHVLDQQRGCPAADLAVTLLDASGAQLCSTRTDEDGRVSAWPGAGELAPGSYRLRFDVGAYFARTETPTFYDQVEIAFRADAADAHFHVPLLLSPYGYSTYRGS